MSENGQYPDRLPATNVGMVLDPDGCFRALRSRDPRFDGIFFVAITSTRIYCRPICPARPAKRENCRFYDSAAAAERDGYRPCLRCRPEIAPGNARVDAVERIAGAALSRIEAGALNGHSVEELAAEFGITSRHLRRAVETQFGISPVQAAQTQRLLLAKQLLTETSLPVTAVAFASGFESVRRFNSLFGERYRMPPTAVRGRRVTAAVPGDSITCEVGYRAPFRWADSLAFLQPRLVAGIETIEGQSYSRLATIGKHRGMVRVSESRRPNSLSVEIATTLLPVLPTVLAKVKRLFDLDAHPECIADRLSEDPRLKPLVAAAPGLRVPGAFDGFEMALRAVLGQQITIRAATTIAGRFVARFGELNAEAIARAGRDELCPLGLTGARADTVAGLARAVADGFVRLEPGVDVQETIGRLTSLAGIGPWTAQYIAMRALGWPDAFPHTDLWVYKALDTRSPKRVLETAQAWSPWRSYAVMHLWRSVS